MKRAGRRVIHDRSQRLRNVLLAVCALVVLGFAGYVSLPQPAPSPTDAPLMTIAIPSPTPTTAKLPQAIRALFFGDSLMQRDDTPGSPPQMSQIAAKALGWDVTIDAFGGTGYTVAGPLASARPFEPRLADALAGPEVFDVVLLEGGTNDVMNPNVAEVLAPNLKSAIALVRADQPKAKIVLMGIYAPFGSPVPRVSARIDDLMSTEARRLHLPFFSPIANGWLKGQPASFTGADNFHPTATGAAYLGQRLTQELRSLNLAPTK